jgi:hypothetical protein
MKIAISGHTAGIGKSFARYFADRGHKIVGASRREGMNIRSIPKVFGHIQDCDMFINNAQVGFAQTELLYKLWTTWANENKMIWLISSMMSSQSDVPYDMEEYKAQKQALENAFYNLKGQGRCKLVLIRPGTIATQPYNTVGLNAVDVDDWVNTICDTWIQAHNKQMFLEEISLGFRHKPIMEL